MCDAYKRARLSERPFYQKPPTSQMPIAFTISMRFGVEQFERFLLSIYHPNNIYCVHIDKKSDTNVKKAVKSIASCFDNVFVATKLETVVWGGFSILKAQLNCMNDLINLENLVGKHENLIGKRIVNWEYSINTASSEFPLRSYIELVQILAIYNGSNEIEMVLDFDLESRVKFSVFQDAQNGILNQTEIEKSPPPHNFTLAKGYTYVIMHRKFLEYALLDQRARDLLKWLEDTWNPDETFWQTLQFNTQFYPDSGFVYLNESKIDTIALFAAWEYQSPCKGLIRNAVCVFSIEDLAYVTKRKELRLNKFMLFYDPIAYQCIEEWYYEREGRDLNSNETSYYCNWIRPHSSRVKC